MESTCRQGDKSVVFIFIFILINTGSLILREGRQNIMRKISQAWVCIFAMLLVNVFLTLSVQAEVVVLVEKVKVPFTYAKGVKLYRQNCSSCHGRSLEGTKQGPPLLHPFYKASHHDDSAFYRAALKGVKAHHWQFEI